jgi:hypothetical protein
MSTMLRRLFATDGRIPLDRARPKRPRRGFASAFRRMERLEERVLLSTFTVTNLLDDGSTGSLRWAINEVNADTSRGTDTIDFDVPGTGPFVIAPSSPLPTITHQVLVNGYSQPGASPNTEAGGDNAVILIEIGGANAGFTSGLTLQADRSTIQGLAINGFAQDGIHLLGGRGDVVAGNFLGTDPTGMTAVPNQDAGVLIDGATGATIGGTTAAARNIVSGNYNQDIYFINNSSGNVVQGNWVGLSAAGNATLSTYGAGVSFEGSNNNTVGGLTPAAGNVISGPTFDGVAIDSSSGVVVQGNLIGTDPTGTIALGAGSGVFVGYGNASNDVIGGTKPGAGNVISGNQGDGVLINSQVGSGIVIQGNWIGTDITGTVALPNTGNGVHIQGNGVTVGGAGRNVGPALGARNVISGNLGDGIFLDGASFNLVQGNLIGTTAAGKPLGNGGDGVFEGYGFLDVYPYIVYSMNNTVGGTATGAGNVIAYNGHNGVTVGYFTGDASAGDTILSNSIYGNAALGIDLADDGVTPNVPGGVFGAPNDLQPYPNLLAFAQFGTKTLITGSLDDVPDTTYTIQIFGNPAADPSGYGQGQILLSTQTVTTDANGIATFQVTIASLPIGITSASATATDPFGDTSEFANDVPLMKVSSPVVAVNDAYYTDINTTLNVAAPGVLTNDLSFLPGPLTSALVTPPADGSVTLNSDGSFNYTPDSGFTGTDTFTYQDTASGQTSNIATVTIQVLPKTFVVTNTNDSGPGSLRQAILYANLSNSAPPDTIDFDIPGTGPFVISPLSVLPTIAHPTIIDGYSQPGASPNTLQIGDNAVILIQIDGSAAGFPNGLTITAGASTVQGLSITDFSAGIELTGAGGNVISGNFIGTDPTGTLFEGNSAGVLLEDVGNDLIGGSTPDARNVISANSVGIEMFFPSSGNLIQGNYIGTDATGELSLGNSYGLLLEGGPSTTIGGPTPGDGNVISGNFEGVLAFQDDLLIQGNLVGTDATGELPLGNFYGLDLEEGGGSTIGGTAVGEGNVISGNSFSGIYLVESGDLVEGNLIGTDQTGVNALGNAGDGVTILSFFGPSSNNTIGGTVAGAGNVIAVNGAVGVDVQDPNDTGMVLNNAILSNSIYGNAALGIDLGDDGVTPNHQGGLINGPNGFENYPVLSSAVASSSGMTVPGTLNAAASETFTIQFFSNPTSDPSGHGQGQTYLGSITVTTDSNGNASFTATLPVVPAGYAISATATDPNGNTSEFSQDVTVTTAASSTAAAAVVRSTSGAVATGFAGRDLAAVDAALAGPLGPAPDQAALIVLAAEISHTKSKPSKPST